MPRRGRMYRRFLASTGGLAAIEFGLVFPMLLLLLLAGIDAGRAVAVSMKVRTAAYALNAMANTYLLSIDDTNMTGILNAASKILSPYPLAPATVTLTQVKINSGGQATVSWSDTLNGTAHVQGASITIPAALTTTSAPNNTCKSYPCYVLLAEVTYTYTPMFGHFITGPINLSDKTYVTPRSVTCIQRNNIPVSC
jgi:Flp pilus assembly protein TadG